MHISDWSSDVCSSDLLWQFPTSKPNLTPARMFTMRTLGGRETRVMFASLTRARAMRVMRTARRLRSLPSTNPETAASLRFRGGTARSEEHTSELQSLMRISYAVFCLKKKKQHSTH